jgi:hypothetical protein
MSKFAADIARYRAKGSGGKELWLNPAVRAIWGHQLGGFSRSFVPVDC